jgi:hypothetical protein
MLSHLTRRDRLPSSTTRASVLSWRGLVGGTYSVGVPRKQDIISDVVIIQNFECPVLVGLIAVPGVIVEWVLITVGNTFI